MDNGDQKFAVLTSRDRSPSCRNPKKKRHILTPLRETAVNHGQAAALTAQWMFSSETEEASG